MALTRRLSSEASRPNFMKILDTCLATAADDSTSFAAMSLLESPCDMSSSTSCSRGVRVASPEREVDINALATVGSMTVPPLATMAKECKNEDRKSTRLNSSHVAISYAVFCLKKKNVYKE